MTRVLKFMKVDLRRIRRFLWIALFPVIAVVVMATDGEVSPMFGLVYCLFCAIFVSGMPYNIEKPEEMGFLQMLPARPGEQIYGHYLFGFLAVLAAVVVGLLCGLGVSAVFSRSLSGVDPNLCLALIGGALLLVGLEYLLLTVFRFNSMQAMQLLRTVPPLVFFFVIARLSKSFSFEIELPRLNGAVILIVCAAGYALLAAISGRVAGARGQG